MKKTTRARLERRGWKVGNADEFLGLSPEESRYIDLKLALSRQLRERREASHLTQSQLADRIGSSQSRVAKMESGDPTVSIDLLVRSLFALGASRRKLGKIITSKITGVGP